MQPIEHLLQEHRDIMAQIAELRAAARDLAARGGDALPGALPALRRSARLTETQLAWHARKEDEILFPALEALLGAEASPTAMMRVEHTEIHTQAVVLRALVADESEAAALRACAEELIALLDMHFEKEEHMLFPMIEQLLDGETLAEVGRQFEAMPPQR